MLSDFPEAFIFNLISSSLIRPTFLSILCSLTFFSAVSGLWIQSERLWNPQIAAEKTRMDFEKAQETLHARSMTADTETMDGMFDAILDQANAENTKVSAIILLIFESLSLYAAYLMWNLQKQGFYLYLAGMAVAFIAPLLLIGGWMGIITALAGIITSVIMAILYAFNLKYMS